MSGTIIGGIYYFTASHQSYGPGTYKVGENISSGTYNRTGEAMVLNGKFVSAGDILVIEDSPNAEVEVVSGELIKINDSTTYNPGNNVYFTSD